MKKKVLTLIVAAVFMIVNMIPSIVAFAGDTSGGIIHVEEKDASYTNYEKFSSKVITPSSVADGELSGGKIFALRMAKTDAEKDTKFIDADNKYIIEYDVNVAEEGTYSFKVVCHDFSQYTSNFNIKINDDIQLYACKDSDEFKSEPIYKVNVVSSSVKLYEYDFGTFTLNSGKNTVIFEISEYRTFDDNQILFFFDYFEFEKESEPCNVTLTKESEQESISDLTGSAQYNPGSTATITAAVKPGQNYVFDRWVNINDANDVVYSPIHSFIVTSDVTYKAVFKPLAKYAVVAGTNDDALGSVSISPQQASYNYGTQVTLTATAKTGGEFIGWEENGKQVTTTSSNTYIFNVESSHNIRAIFAQQDSAKNKVTFKDASGRILKIDLVADGGSAVAPDEPSKAGYEFDKWDKPLTNITGDTVIYALYKKSDATYTVSVSNGTISSSGGNNASCQFDTQVTVVADAAPAGQKFSHWTKNGKIASYNTSYSFYVSEVTTLEAVFVLNDATINKLPCITIDSNPIVKSNEISFIAQCTVDGVSYTEANIEEYGVLLSQSNNPDLGTAGVIRGKAGSKTNGTGQFMITKTNVTPGQTWYGRAYMIYRDGSGNLITIYSNTVSAGL